ncbi:MAG: flavodoxin-dependent (E)-4-hydroxy-3-methylbut-2-enyl-diphosphate synthase [Sphaerochaetaceae bacterium]|nr:flavodoxin-dependent (E)-4-hydroxy-3-methylbut-2-enyl-diphosphate synthase [Sphaerochaetaceae bacterium]
MDRRVTKQVRVGNLSLGGSAKIAVQTMWSHPLPDKNDAKGIEALLDRLRTYATMGCDIIRFAYHTEADREVFSIICKESPMPIVADIHFDYRLAIDAFTCGAHKIRINPGNIGSKQKVEDVVRCAQDNDGAIRIGLNGGSLPIHLRSQDHARAMVDTALTYIDWFESWDFDRIVLSLKDSDLETTYRSYTSIAESSAYPIHLGVTEAGGIVSSSVRSTWVLGRLLNDGIGDTIRISITDDIEYEIEAAKELLRAVGIESKGIRVVSCPRCGRSTFDSQKFLKQVQSRLSTFDVPLTVAIMGCQVNGPGEASHADIAITGIGQKVFLYEHGVLKRQVSADEAESALFETLEAYINAQ